MGEDLIRVEVSAPTNIAIVKYWGKRCQKLNLPLNSSLSATLCQDHMKTTTTVETSRSFTEDELFLNDIRQDITGNRRLVGCLHEVRRVARIKAIKSKNDSPSRMKFFSQKVKIYSKNNFPTAAGLASSASGYAALVYAMGQLLGIEGNLTSIARQGSGSACRSLHGGFVQWNKGAEETGEDSIGMQIAPENHWDDLRIFVIVVNDTRKKIGSTDGMQLTAKTSKLLKHRVEYVVEEHIKAAGDAIKNKIFPKLAEIIMQESNQLHALCLDTFPPLHYLNDTSFMIIELVHAYNAAVGSLQVAYTFDAGPNACLFTTKDHADEIAWLISYFFPDGKASAEQYFRGMKVDPVSPRPEILEKLNLETFMAGLLKYVICTQVGCGPKLINFEGSKRCET